MAPAFLTTLLTTSLRARTTPTTLSKDSVLSALGPLAANSALLARDPLLKRDDSSSNPPTTGVIDPHAINNNAIFALFGLIGVAFVVIGIWFFFWAKNGGFYFKENDWDDYKTTVLRRRGPNGTLLSGATESTNLGGGSVYKDVDDGSTDVTARERDRDAQTVITESTAMTGITAGVSDIGAREKRRKKKEQREREKERRREEKAREKEEYKRRKAGKRKVGEDGLLVDEEAEAEAKAQLRNYRHEKPARVGGLNKETEGSAWDGSTNPSHSTMSQSQSQSQTGTGYSESTVTSELIANRERTPTSTPTKKTGGIRKVYSTADKNDDRERERLRAEARKLQEKGRAAVGKEKEREPRRDFSWKQADDHTPLRTIEEASAVSSRSGGGRSRSRPAARDEVESRIPGSWTESDVGTSSEVGTKVYHHSVHIPIPSATASSVTSTSDFAYQEEKRKRRQGAGYRRDRNRD